MFKYHCWWGCLANCKDFIAENCLLANFCVLRQGRLPSILLYLPWNKCLIISVNLEDCHPLENFSAPYYLFIHEIFIKSLLTLCQTLCRNYLYKDESEEFLSISRLQVGGGTRWVKESAGSRVTVVLRAVWGRNNGRVEKKEASFTLLYVPGLDQQRPLRESGHWNKSSVLTHVHKVDGEGISVGSVVC